MECVLKHDLKIIIEIVFPMLCIRMCATNINVLIKGLYCYYYYLKPLQKQVKSTLTYRTHETENKPRRQICSKSTSMLEAGRDACRTLRLHLLGI